MRPADYLKKIAVHSCIYYTASTFCILFLYWAVNADLSRGMHPGALFFILPFSVCFACANIIWKSEKLKTAARLFLHCLLTLGGIWLFLYLPNKEGSANGSQSLILFVVFLLLYFIVMGTILIVKSRIKRIKRDTSNYTGVYNKK